MSRLRAGLVVFALILILAAALLNAMLAQAAGGWVLLSIDGIRPAAGVNADEVHAQVGLAQAVGLFLAAPGLLIAINPRVGSVALLIAAAALVAVFASLSYIGIGASLPGACLLLIAAALGFGATSKVKSRAGDTSARTSSRAIQWPRFDPNKPGDLERAVKEVRRIQNLQQAQRANPSAAHSELVRDDCNAQSTQVHAAITPSGPC